ncbi:hypothetical protein A2U01_0059866 [Trifolium medium]|uniref:Uncharacterized protein n=1 Tax=Trifolium medium TaxID=97028 RepID=A0A392RPQ1_9FABA|nr:hypothetical protein [Trifolium medium]
MQNTFSKALEDALARAMEKRNNSAPSQMLQVSGAIKDSMADEFNNIINSFKQQLKEVRDEEPALEKESTDVVVELMKNFVVVIVVTMLLSSLSCYCCVVVVDVVVAGLSC